MKIFSGSSNKPLAQKIAKNLNLPLSSLDIHIFSDGEKRVQTQQSVVDEEVVVLQSTGIPVDENYMELFLIIDSLKRSGAKSVTALVPYMGYQRQDHVFREGEARSFEVIVKILEVIGVDKLITFDLHSIKIPQLFKIPVIQLSALPLFAERIKEFASPAILVSPDRGGIRRIKQISEMLGNMPFAVVSKNRDLITGEIKAEKIEGEIKEIAFIVDDMISTGGTILEASKLLRQKGVKQIYVFATHAVFSNDAKSLLSNAPIEKIFVTDTMSIPKEKQFEKLEIISIAKIIASELLSH